MHPRLQLSGITKIYPTVVANQGIDLSVLPGEIHAVLGENGAGKSTLMKIIYGVVEPDAGTIRWEGHEVTIDNPARARRLGIGMVFQHFSLFETLRRLAAEGCSILYISHKLDEIRALCHKATVLRSGQVTGECDPRNESSSSLARMMIGADLPHPRHREAHAGEAALVVSDLTLPADDPFGTSLSGINLDVHAGEIVGIAGVSGNGQKELMAALSGERPLAEAATVTILGTAAGRLDAAQRRALGFAFVPEERLGRGAVPEMSLADNALLTAHREGMVAHGFVRADVVCAYAVDTIKSFGVKAGGPDAAARSLSGGNLQKFIVGREIRQQPKVMIAAQPTWGVDVGAAAQIRQALLDLRDTGVAILVVSEELDELFEICDRLAVMARGRLSSPKPVRETNAAEIGMLMSGAFIAPATDAAADSREVRL